jgi:hypothetical protein
MAGGALTGVEDLCFIAQGLISCNMTHPSRQRAWEPGSFTFLHRLHGAGCLGSLLKIQPRHDD